MTTILMIAGHGKNKDGSFDPGALGYIAKGEHKYYLQDMFPAMKKFLPEKHNVVFFTDYNVFDYGNLVALAAKYGKDTIVVEWHYDAFTENAAGGHVVIHEDFTPDTLDLKLRDVIKKHIGVRYTHKGQSGIDGRTNLGNANRAAKGNTNYRLIELGFGTNKKDSTVMINNIDQIAKDFVIALVGSAKNEKDVPAKIEGVEKMSTTKSGKETMKCINHLKIYEKPTRTSKVIKTKAKDSNMLIEGYVYGEAVFGNNIWWYKVEGGFAFSGDFVPVIGNLFLDKTNSI